MDRNTELYIYDRLMRINLKSIRKHMHYTQSMISELSGLSLSTISNIESEDNNASSSRMDSIIAYLNAMNYEIKFQPKDEKQQMIKVINNIKDDVL